MLCDPDGKVCVCDECGQLFSPYWSARKSQAMHERGTAHSVRVIDLTIPYAYENLVQTSIDWGRIGDGRNQGQSAYVRSSR